MRTVAFVIPWYGESLKGGAEQFAWQFSHRLAERGHRVEVLTTCCSSFLEDWNVNQLAEGEETLGENLLVRRFAVRHRNPHTFSTANERLLDISAEQLRPFGQDISAADASAFIEENIRSTDLTEFVRQKSDKYEAVIFIPYLYGPTFDCLPLVAEKAYLHACLHDEVYAYLPQVEQLFRQAKGILYNSSGEKLLAESLYGPGIVNKGVVVGGGVEVAANGELLHADRINGVDLASTRYFLYLGRRDATKNTEMLVAVFKKFAILHAFRDVYLYLAGPGERSFSDETCNIKDFGLVSDLEKESLLRHCAVLLQPSSNESYSRSVMEAWLYAKPVGVHRTCLATAEPVEMCGGGWVADTDKQWLSLLASAMQASPSELHERGLKGQEYAREYASWSSALDRYECALGLAHSEVGQDDGQSRPGKIVTIVQLTAGMTYGDAISNQAIFIRDYLRACGYRSEIVVEVLDPACAGDGKVYAERMLDDADAIIYHHSIGSELSRVCANYAGPKALIYHNITPAEFYAPYNTEIADLLIAGRRELEGLVGAYSCQYGDSEYNAQELLDLGAASVGVLPIAVDPGVWHQQPCAEVLTTLGDGRRNILFVGRISPNKCQEELLLAFNHYRTLDPESRLILVGGYGPQEKYFLQLQESIAALGLIDDVVVAGKVSQQQLQGYYLGSHLFWSMSEHEGFGVPLVESMWFELPVMAFKSSAVPETLAQGGIIFSNKQDYTQLALLAARMLHDDSLRRDIILGQRERRMDFHPAEVAKSVESLLVDLERQKESLENQNAV